MPGSLTVRSARSGCIVQVALKVRPLPRARRTLRVPTDDPIAVGRDLLEPVPLPVAVLAMQDAVLVRVEGWPDEVAEQTDAARSVVGQDVAIEDDAPLPRWSDDAPIVAEVSVAPSRVGEIVPYAGHVWEAPLGTGLLWAAPGDDDALAALRERVRDAGGIAPVIKGPGGLGSVDLGAGESVQRRLKHAFDPAGVLAPGRGLGGI